ncbi:MAG: homoserine O-succinyltransferase [Acidobacteriota bacterium]
MPIIAHCDLPAFDRLRGEGYDVLRPEEALRQDIRELHVGLLNLMPDAALRATERQFLRLLGACNRIVQIRVHLITVDEPSRGAEARGYLGRYYERFDEIRRVGLDALVVSGANPARERLEDEDFWEPMLEILDWAEEHVHSVLCSCLSTHAVLQRSYGVERQPRPSKRWGVYSHRVVDAGHPLVRDVNTRFDAPRSHRFEVTSAQLEAAGCPVLATSERADFYLGTSPDGFRYIFFQGHPEYDTDSLLKEYKREFQRFVEGDRGDFPPYPGRYFSDAARDLLDRHRADALDARRTGRPAPDLPEEAVEPLLENTWTDTGKALFNNWLGQVYRRMG